ncbi:uncharacterized protein EAE97_000663 [Botrytis byssoidea]|uniref:Uncharacterized protein n=1 Tax=Botrytis byssoidea TaxID=139641 RepID=A0A9P5IYI5_9HELO|nr:uncharacterized protein EAE97_000663 [Botrytis byssoidea]KAF7955404.1 hypothetical protein EAE97_000663 [Botrytis byssoidea]
MSARVAFRRMIPFAGVATTATLACYGANRVLAFERTPAKHSTLKSHRIVCAASAYGVYSGFCKEMCTIIFDGCKGEWDRVKVVDKASNLEPETRNHLMVKIALLRTLPHSVIPWSYL